MITDEYLIELFNNDPAKFFNTCSDISDETGELPPFGKYIYIKLSILKGVPLPNYAYNLVNDLEKVYGKIDVSDFLKYDQLPTVKYFEDVLVERFKSVAQILKQEDEKKYEGWIEFNNSLADNVYFSKKNRDLNGFKYSIENTPILMQWLTNFKTISYKIDDTITIKLTPSGFFHILFGHIDGYLVPRKGAMVKIDNVHSCEALLKLIGEIVLHIKVDLINHFNAKTGKFEKKDIVYLETEYAMNIDSKKRILSFYPVDRRFTK